MMYFRVHISKSLVFMTKSDGKSAKVDEKLVTRIM